MSARSPVVWPRRWWPLAAVPPILVWLIPDRLNEMIAAEVVNPPPPFDVGIFRPAFAVALAVVLTAILLVAAARFDETKGPLTISLLIVLGMLGAVAYCLIFTIPNDDITPGVVGGLTAGFGAVVAYWLGRRKDSGSPPE